jgi:hypothetical protein
MEKEVCTWGVILIENGWKTSISCDVLSFYWEREVE